MDTDLILDALRGTMWVIVQLVGPTVVPALLCGLVVGVLQAATSISESTLSFVPKLIVTLLALALMGAMILRVLSDFTIDLFDRIPGLLK